MEHNGLIKNLELQPKYSMDVCGIHICNYVADFRYRDSNGKAITEDVKGVKTAVYRIKAKLLKALHDIDVLET